VPGRVPTIDELLPLIYSIFEQWTDYKHARKEQAKALKAAQEAAEEAAAEAARETPDDGKGKKKKNKK
jgi:hypothetical protein